MKKKLMLAMSGGVDSSAALVLITQQYDVVGATLALSDRENSADIADAKTVAEKFGVPHYVFEMKQLFKRHVVDYFVDTYLAGGTPNPCVQCNKYIKFGALLDEAEKLGCEYFSTGHYARVEFDEESGRYLLKKALCDGKPNPKDQSYVLYNLTQQQLKRIVLPLGNMDKNQVRAVAESAGLVNSRKGDSQDICFIPDGDYAGFINRCTGRKPICGSFIDADGNILGTHRGLIHYTIGQRKGLGISFGKPIFVVDKNAEENTVTLGGSEALMRRSLTAREVNYIAFDELCAPLPCKAKTRYSQQEQPCMVTPLANGRARVDFDQPQRAITRGQSVVFYQDDVVLGGGIIE